MSGAGMPRRLTRLGDKQSYDEAELHRLLDSTYLGHIAWSHEGQPAVAPTAVVRVEDRLVWHGSTGSHWMRLIAAGTPVAVSVAALDAIVVARSRFESSFRYRSAVMRGVPTVLEGAEKEAVLDLIVERLIPGRVGETRPSTAKEVAATLVLAMPLDDWVLKVSDGWPEDAPEDLDSEVWAGVVPIHEVYGDPLAAPDLASGVPVPASVRALTGR